MVDKLPEEEHPKPAFGWAARDQSGVLSPFKFSRRFFLIPITLLLVSYYLLFNLLCAFYMFLKSVYILI